MPHPPALGDGVVTTVFEAAFNGSRSVARLLERPRAAGGNLLSGPPGLLGRGCLPLGGSGATKSDPAGRGWLLVKTSQLQTNNAAPASVSFTYVPLSCITSQPFVIACSSPALYSARRALELIQEGPVDLLNVDPAVLNRFERVRGLINLRAATSGSVKGLFSTNFIVE